MFNDCISFCIHLVFPELNSALFLFWLASYLSVTNSFPKFLAEDKVLNSFKLLNQCTTSTFFLETPLGELSALAQVWVCAPLTLLRAVLPLFLHPSSLFSCVYLLLLGSHGFFFLILARVPANRLKQLENKGQKADLKLGSKSDKCESKGWAPLFPVNFLTGLLLLDGL